MYGLGGRPEYSILAKWGDKGWTNIVDPSLRFLLGNDEETSLLRIRAAVQIIILVALAVLIVSPFWNSAHMITAAGLLFDIAGAARLFLFEEIENALSGYKPNEHGNYPSVAMREFIMPEGINEEKINNNPTSFFYYRKRGVLFLFFGFVLQMIGDFI